MNSFLKYIIYFLLGLMVYLLKANLIEGNENAFPFLARIMGQNEKGEYTTKYTGCHKYECDNISKYSFEELELKDVSALQTILNLDESRLDTLPTEKNQLIYEILKIDRSNKYSTKEYNTDLDFLTCNNEMDYSPASMLGSRCNHEKCCFNSKCSSTDVQGLPNITCGSGRTLKQDAHCIDEKNCRNKFVSLCCTEHNAIINPTIKDIFLVIYNENNTSISIDDFNAYLNGDFDDNSYRITGQNILDYINDPSVPLSSGTLSSDDLNNFLGTFDGSNPLSSKSYDIYDFNDLVKS